MEKYTIAYCYIFSKNEKAENKKVFLEVMGIHNKYFLEFETALSEVIEKDITSA